MVHHIFTLAALVLVTIVSALPVLPSRDTGCASLQPHALGPGGVPVCLFPLSSTAQTLERRTPHPPNKAHRPKRKEGKKRRPNNRVGHATARREDKKVKATRAETRTGAAKVKPAPAMTDKKKAKVEQKKEARKLARHQKHAAKLAELTQKQKPPPYGIDVKHGKLKEPEQADFGKVAWRKKEAAKTAKEARRAAYNALSTEEKAAHALASATTSAAKRQKDIDNNTKEENRKKRIDTKAAENATRKGAIKAAVKVAKVAYKQALDADKVAPKIPGRVEIPKRVDTFLSPQGKLYNGKDVRQAMYASEYAQAMGKLGYNRLSGKQTKLGEDKAPKSFNNRLNSDLTTPLLGESPKPGRPMLEFPILHDKQKGYDGQKPAQTEARIITQKNAMGQTELKGLVGHPHGTGDRNKDHVAF